MILDHLHGNTRKHNVIFTGFMGAGKTSAGHFYADHYHMPFIDTDQEIEKEAGMAISQIFKEQGEEASEVRNTVPGKAVKDHRRGSDLCGRRTSFKRGKPGTFKEAGTGSISGCFTGDCL